MMKVYISGSLTNGGTLSGDALRANLAKFRDAEAALSEAGLVPLNPASFEGKADSWLGYMRLSLRMISEADGLCMMPGWMLSAGALLEHDVAVRLGLPILTLEEWQAGGLA